jgi:hypothetical protein
MDTSPFCNKSLSKILKRRKKVRENNPKTFHLTKNTIFRLAMKRILTYFLLFGFFLTGCGTMSGRTAKVVKPKYHHSIFDRKKNKRTPRTKVVRMKS